jgi:hypothetical protein
LAIFVSDDHDFSITQLSNDVPVAGADGASILTAIEVTRQLRAGISVYFFERKFRFFSGQKIYLK